MHLFQQFAIVICHKLRLFDYLLNLCSVHCFCVKFAYQMKEIWLLLAMVTYFYTISNFMDRVCTIVAIRKFYDRLEVPALRVSRLMKTRKNFQNQILIEIIDRLYSFSVLVDRNRKFLVKFSSFWFPKIPLRNENFHPEHQCFKLCENKVNSQP